MKNNTSNQLSKQSKPISKARAAKEAPRFREYAVQDRKRAQDCLDQIDNVVAGEKALAECYLRSAAGYDCLADVLEAHAQSDS